MNVIAINTDKFYIWGTAYAFATVYAAIWDFKMDWGFDWHHFPREDVDDDDICLH